MGFQWAPSAAKIYVEVRLLPKKNFKEPTRPKAKKLGPQHVKG